jgi:superfamily II DNA helicase RecQ
MRLVWIFRAMFPLVPITALSATLPLDSLFDVCHVLGLRNAECYLSPLGRADIAFHVVQTHANLGFRVRV